MCIMVGLSREFVLSSLSHKSEGKKFSKSLVKNFLRLFNLESINLLKISELDLKMIPGPDGTHAGSIQEAVRLFRVAACLLLMSTLAAPVTMSSGTGMCGMGVGTGAAGWMGA